MKATERPHDHHGRINLSNSQLSSTTWAGSQAGLSTGAHAQLALDSSVEGKAKLGKRKIPVRPPLLLRSNDSRALRINPSTQLAKRGVPSRANDAYSGSASWV